MNRKLVKIAAVAAAAMLIPPGAVPASEDTSAWDVFASALAGAADTQEWIGTLTKNMQDIGKSQEEIDRVIDEIMNYEKVENDDEALEELLGYLAPEPSKKDLMSGSDLPESNWKEELQFMLDGEMFAMPVSLSVLKDAGWTYTEGAYDVGADTVLIGTADLQKEEYLQANRFDSFYIGAGRISNDSGETKDISECIAQTLEFDCKKSPQTYKPTYPDVMIAGGITFGSTAEEVEAALGEPNDTYRADDVGYTVYYYWSEDEEYASDTKIELTIYDTDGVAVISLVKDAG